MKTKFDYYYLLDVCKKDKDKKPKNTIILLIDDVY